MISHVFSGPHHHLFEFGIGAFEHLEQGGCLVGSLAAEGEAVATSVLELHEVARFGAGVGGAAMPGLMIEEINITGLAENGFNALAFESGVIVGS